MTDTKLPLPPTTSLAKKINQAVGGFLGLRQTKHGINFAVLLVSTIGIVVILNAVLSTRVWQYDLTSKKFFSLSDKTKQVLQRLDKKPLRGIAFFSQESSDSKETTQDLLNSYQSNYNQFSYEFIDPNMEPTLAKQYGIDRNNVLVITYEGKNEIITTIDEESMTNALVKITSKTSKLVCFLKGHGEYTIEDQYSTAKQVLAKDNYQVTSMLLTGQEKVPETCTIMVIPSSKNGLQDNEIQAINAYLQSHGKALFLLNALDSNMYNSLLDDWGITVGSDIIIDTSLGFFRNPFAPILQLYADNPITKKLSSIALHDARMVDQTTTPPQGITVEWLAKTGESSWAETDLTNLRQPSFDRATDRPGPISVAALAYGTQGDATTAAPEEKKPETRIVAIGDTDFITNQYLYETFGNKDFLLNSINWLAEEESLIGISPKEKQNDPIVLSSAQMNMILYTTVLGLPGIVLLLGIIVWWKRRKN